MPTPKADTGTKLRRVDVEEDHSDANRARCDGLVTVASQDNPKARRVARCEGQHPHQEETVVRTWADGTTTRERRTKRWISIQPPQLGEVVVEPPNPTTAGAGTRDEAAATALSEMARKCGRGYVSDTVARIAKTAGVPLETLGISREELRMRTQAAELRELERQARAEEVAAADSRPEPEDPLTPTEDEHAARVNELKAQAIQAENFPPESYIPEGSETCQRQETCQPPADDGWLDWFNEPERKG